MKVHELKIKKMYMKSIITGEKKFEIRKNDRDFKVNDVLQLNEINDIDGAYTGFQMLVRVVYIHQGLGLEEGYVCMAIREVRLNDECN